MKKPFIFLEYKYEREGWREYDRSQVPLWAEGQYERMVREHPEAEHRVRKEIKK